MCKLGTCRGFGTERARLGTFRVFGTERTLRGFGTERERLGTFRGFGTERARLGTLKKNLKIKRGLCPPAGVLRLLN